MTPPLALRREPRDRCPPGEWWKVRHPPPPVPEESSESEPEQPASPPAVESDDELNMFNQSAEFAVDIEYANCTHVCNVADGSELQRMEGCNEVHSC
jgi:hypothetical protein